MFRYVGRLFVKSTGKPIEILTKLNQMAGFDADEEIELFEVCFQSQVLLILWRPVNFSWSEYTKNIALGCLIIKMSKAFTN